MRIGALAGYESSVGHNVLFTVITKTDGTFVSTTQQPLATNYPFGVVAADLNGDGNPDLVAVGNRCEDSSSQYPEWWEPVSPGIVWTVALFGLGGLLSGRRRWRHCMRGLQILCVMAILFHLLGCGGPSSGNNAPGGTSTVTITASAGSTSHAATVTLKSSRRRCDAAKERAGNELTKAAAQSPPF
jgi:MYXO-CTERM domain-containing protein